MTRFGWGFVAGVVFSLAFSAGVSFLLRVQVEYLDFMCSQNLKHGGLLFDDHARQHQGTYPQHIEELDQQRLEGTVHPLRCPKARHLGAGGFLYLRPPTGAPPETPILICWRHPKLWALCKDGVVRSR
jgi:hypothetical protein